MNSEHSAALVAVEAARPVKDRTEACHGHARSQQATADLGGSRDPYWVEEARQAYLRRWQEENGR